MNVKGWGEETHLVAGADFQADVFANGRRRTIRAFLVPLLRAKLGPCLPLRDSMVDQRLLQNAFSAPCDLQGSRKRCSRSERS